MNDFINKTLGEIVTKQNKAVPVLEKYNLDYCCNGKRTLQKACEQNNIDAAMVSDELENIAAEQTIQMPFDEMTAEELISYIHIHHHYYVKQAVPQIQAHLLKLQQKHADKFEWIENGIQTFNLLQEELLQHMQKEETILFPRIKRIEACYNGTESKNAINDILAPIMVMEKEHAIAGALMERLRTITNNYTPAETACNTHRITLAELKEFEKNLHQHVHLENNILFLKAVKLYDELKAA